MAAWRRCPLSQLGRCVQLRCAVVAVVGMLAGVEVGAANQGTSYMLCVVVPVMGRLFRPAVPDLGYWSHKAMSDLAPWIRHSVPSLAHLVLRDVRVLIVVLCQQAVPDLDCLIPQAFLQELMRLT